jgi:two-component system sensor histidine kinase/response regulator
MQNDSLTIEKPLVLIVDDNDDNLNLAASHLKEANYDVVIANSGPIAMGVLEEVIPDVILLDIMMPEMDGYEVCISIKSKRQLKDIPVIFLTAKTDSADILKGFISGGVDYITKPFEKHEFLARVRTHYQLKRSRDIILRQNLELKKLNQEKDGLLGITAHDLKNPLQGIAGLIDVLDTLLGEVSATPEQTKSFHQIISTIKIGTANANKIIMDLLDLHAIEQGKYSVSKASFDPKEIIDKLYNYYQLQAIKKNITIQLHKCSGLCMVNSDKSKLERILDNLISNAIKFSEKNKNIWIKLTTFESSQQEKFLQIEIKDEGPGISEPDQKKLFQKFAKLEARPTDGEPTSRLGLSIVKLLADAIDAKVYCISTYGKGASFFVEIALEK